MKLLIKRLLSHFPSRLPVGLSEFETWSDSIIELAGPFADRDSMQFVMASAIQHLSSNKGSVPKAFFVNTLHKAAANQISAQVFQNIKIKQAEAQQAAAVAAAQPTVEATPAATAPQETTTDRATKP